MRCQEKPIGFQLRGLFINYLITYNCYDYVENCVFQSQGWWISDETALHKLMSTASLEGQHIKDVYPTKTAWTHTEGEVLLKNKLQWLGSGKDAMAPCRTDLCTPGHCV